MADLFRRVGRTGSGYDPHQVDEFFARAQRIYEGDSDEILTSADIRIVTFDFVRHGYVTSAVDNALDRLDSAFTHKERAAFIAHDGQQAWFDQIAERATSLYGRLTRPDGQKFAPAAPRKRAYVKADVDELCGRLVDYFNNNVPITANEVRRATFATTKGPKGYAEGPVDAFLDRAVEILVAAE